MPESESGSGGIRTHDRRLMSPCLLGRLCGKLSPSAFQMRCTLFRLTLNPSRPNNAVIRRYPYRLRQTASSWIFVTGITSSGRALATPSPTATSPPEGMPDVASTCHLLPGTSLLISAPEGSPSS